MTRTVFAIGYTALLVLACIGCYCAGRAMRSDAEEFTMRWVGDQPLPAPHDECWNPGVSVRNIGLAEQPCHVPGAP